MALAPRGEPMESLELNEPRRGIIGAYRLENIV